MPYRLKSSCQLDSTESRERLESYASVVLSTLQKTGDTSAAHTTSSTALILNSHFNAECSLHCNGFSTAGWHSISIPLAVCMLKLILWGVKCSIHRGLWMNTSTAYTFTIKEIVLWDICVVVYCFHFGEFRRLCVRFGDMIVFGVFRPLDRYANWLLC